MVRREVIRNATRSPDGRDRVLENQVIHARMFDDQRKAIEVLDAGFEFTAIEQVHGDRQLFTASIIQEHVLNIRGTGLRFRKPL